MEKLDIKFDLPIEALEEKSVSSTPIFDGKVLHVRLDEITLPNGVSSTREYCHHNGAVCVLPFLFKGFGNESGGNLLGKVATAHILFHQMSFDLL
jgi:hypothetical protein